jgi:hypothetical protein
LIDDDAARRIGEIDAQHRIAPRVEDTMKRLPRRSGLIRLTMSFVVGTAFVAVSSGTKLVVLPATTDPSGWIALHARTRAWLDLAVVVFQVSSVATLLLSRLLPRSPWADRGRLAFLASMVGLGATGTVCAWYGSDFSLFAGGTMAVLLNIVILSKGAPEASRPALLRCSAEGFMTV